MELLEIPSFFCGLAAAYFAVNAYNLLRHAPKTHFNRVLGVIFVWWAFSNAKDMVLSIPGYDTQLMLDVVALIDGWSTITYACLMFELSKPGWVTWKRLWLLSVPFTGFSLAYAITQSSALIDVYMGFLVTFGLTVFFIGLYYARIYIRYIYANYSNVDDIDITWMLRVCLMAFPIELLWVLVTIVDTVEIVSIYYLVNIVLWQVVLHLCKNLQPVEMLQEEAVSDGQEEAAEPSAAVADAPVATDAAAQPAAAAELRSYPFADELERMMVEEKLYLIPTLSLADLTTKIGTNRTYLSDYFCNVKHVTFYDYINEMRIRLASLPMMAEHREYTMEHIAAASGFNSLSTFRRAFKKFTGKTPREYRDKMAQ